MKNEMKESGQIFCDAQSGLCKDSEKVWGIISENKKGIKKLHRLTFSKSLAQLIVEQKSESGYRLARFEYRVGKDLEVGETSSTGLYALVSKGSDVVLRISLFKSLSAIHYDENSRTIKECYLREIA